MIISIIIILTTQLQEFWLLKVSDRVSTLKECDYQEQAY